MPATPRREKRQEQAQFIIFSLLGVIAAIAFAWFDKGFSWALVTGGVATVFLATIGVRLYRQGWESMSLSAPSRSAGSEEQRSQTVKNIPRVFLISIPVGVLTVYAALFTEDEVALVAGLLTLLVVAAAVWLAAKHE